MSALLDMGIWSDDGRVWLPKDLYPSRNAAKMFAVHELGHLYIDVRVRSTFMRLDSEDAFDERPYCVCGSDDSGAFAVWEIS